VNTTKEIRLDEIRRERSGRLPRGAEAAVFVKCLSKVSFPDIPHKTCMPSSGSIVVVPSLNHMWTTPTYKASEKIFDRIACDHMSGLCVRSHMTAGQDGFRDARSKQNNDL
jgi:hypothetical protein